MKIFGKLLLFLRDEMIHHYQIRLYRRDMVLLQIVPCIMNDVAELLKQQASINMTSQIPPLVINCY